MSDSVRKEHEWWQGAGYEGADPIQYMYNVTGNTRQISTVLLGTALKGIARKAIGEVLANPNTLTEDSLPKLGAGTPKHKFSYRLHSWRMHSLLRCVPLTMLHL
jgi:hypothetical protein